MTKEEKFVVNPLQEYFLDPKRSGAKWWIKDRPRYGTAATGWDLQVERHNQVLLIEAKYIRGAFAASMAGLIISPLSLRREVMKRKGLKKSWSGVVCWAIGTGYKKIDKYRMRDMYQILLDYIARNPEFWKFYSQLLKVKYIFFIENEKVGKISFAKMIKLAEKYKSSLDEPMKERRSRATDLLGTLKFK
jgi:hypothetical protein